ncbi:MAG TPA: hypothetical protein PLF28_05560 [Agitococcus sp.]|nr:hypothetical protein [Agitococcus sp.]
MKIYLDTCCLNRPFDNQADPRIHLETEAIKTIISWCEQGKYQLLTSEVLQLEIRKTPDLLRQKYLNLLLTPATENILISTDIIQKAKDFEQAGIKAFDALHLACATFRADILLTVDDKFLKKALTINQSKLRVANPLKWLEEVLYDFYS